MEVVLDKENEARNAELVKKISGRVNMNNVFNLEKAFETARLENLLKIPVLLNNYSSLETLVAVIDLCNRNQGWMYLNLPDKKERIRFKKFDTLELIFHPFGDKSFFDKWPIVLEQKQKILELDSKNKMQQSEIWRLNNRVSSLETHILTQDEQIQKYEEALSQPIQENTEAPSETEETAEETEQERLQRIIRNPATESEEEDKGESDDSEDPDEDDMEWKNNWKRGQPLPEEVNKKVEILLKEGKSMKQIAMRMGIGIGSVWRIKDKMQKRDKQP